MSSSRLKKKVYLNSSLLGNLLDCDLIGVCTSDDQYVTSLTFWNNDEGERIEVFFEPDPDTYNSVRAYIMVDETDEEAADG